MSDPAAPPFDAVAAAKELDDLLGEPGVPARDETQAAYVADLETEIEELNALVAKRDAELREANRRADQAHAEIEAAGRRLAKASATELEQRSRKLLESLLPVVDDLDRAITAARGARPSPGAAATPSAQVADLVAGIELVRRNLLGRLAALGVTHAPALGEPFDPQRHDAVALVPVTDPAQDGRVIDVLREGYLVGEHTLRPASVAVGKLTAA